MERISFVIINDDAVEYCKILFESLKKQRHLDKYKVEFAFIDNHSIDGSVECATNFGIKNIFSFQEKIECRGLLYNKGIECSSGDYIIFAHSDIYLEEDFFENIFEYIERKECPDYVNFAQKYADHSYFGNNHIGIDIETGKLVYRQLFEWNPNVLVSVECSEGCFMVKTETFKLYRFDCSYHNSFYEYDFLFQMMAKNAHGIKTINNIFFTHYFIELHEKIKTLKDDEKLFLSNVLSQIIKPLLQEYHSYKSLIPHYFTQFFLDTGLGFNETQSITKQVQGQERIIEFDLCDYTDLCYLRFDPANAPAAIHLVSIELLGMEGERYPITTYQTNACHQNGQNYIFDTNDPMITFASPAAQLQKVVIALEYVALGNAAYPYIYHKQAQQIQQQAQQHDEVIRRYEEKLSREIHSKTQLIQIQDDLIQKMENTLSWKITKPLRAIRNYPALKRWADWMSAMFQGRNRP